MLWVLLFVGIAVAGLVLVVGHAVWLAHKTGDLFSELAVLADRGGQLADLLAQIGAPAPAAAADTDGEPDAAVAPLLSPRVDVR